jgi:hypothetical protein
VRKYHKRCRYCRVEFTDAGAAPTWDHQVPKWVLRLFPQVHLGRHFFVANRVTACNHCNRRKGSMPAAVFVSLIGQPGNIVKAERSKWDRLSEEFARLHYEEANAHPLAEMIVAEFRRPLPPHFATGQKKVEIRAGATVERTTMFQEES